MKICLPVLSLILNIIGTVILAIPFLNVEKDLSDDLLIGGKKTIINGKERVTYIRVGFLKDRKNTLWGLGFLLLGFVLQLIEVFIRA